MGGNADIYQSDYRQYIDDLLNAMATGSLSGQSVSPTPDLIGQSIATSINGSYDAKTGEITTNDGRTLKVDDSGNVMVKGDQSNYPQEFYDQMNALPTDERAAFKVNWEKQNNWTPGAKYDWRPMTSSDAGFDTIQNSLANTQSSFSNPNSAWSQLGGAFTRRYYDPDTGQYVNADTGKYGETGVPTQLTSDYYLNNYGSYLDTPYQQYNYKSPTINSIDPVIDEAWETMYNSRSDDAEARYRDQMKDTDEWIAMQGGSLSSGRRQGLQEDINKERNTELDKIRSEVESEKAMQKYDEAQKVRDMQTNYDWQTQEKLGEESRYGYESGQKQGQEKMQSAEAIDSANRDRAFQESQASKQDMANMFTMLNDLLKTYAGMDSTAASYEASKANAIGSALSGLSKVTSSLA